MKPRIYDLNFKIEVQNNVIDWPISISELDERIFTDKHWGALIKAVRKFLEDGEAGIL
jgi:hypothetical protein|tara:strand:- start:552 stop:725 length:174 start_codon:yes stop_codon:yes gene_type:complete